MTVEQLEELLGKVTQGDWVAVAAGQADDLNEVVTYSPFASIADAEGYNAALIAIAPSLARRVIAAEKLVEALDRSLSKSVTVGDMAELDDLITAYREASQ